MDFVEIRGPGIEPRGTPLVVSNQLRFSYRFPSIVFGLLDSKRKVLRDFQSL